MSETKRFTRPCVMEVVVAPWVSLTNLSFNVWGGYLVDYNSTLAGPQKFHPQSE